MTFRENTIGVVGHGFVGQAVHYGMEHAFKVKVFDIKNAGGTNDVLVGSLKQLAEECEVIFVCVPTPMDEDGTCNTGIVESVVGEIASFGQGNVVVIKSTVSPGTTERLNDVGRQGLTGGIIRGVVFSPEFLTEANYIDDFKRQTRVIIGGEEPAKSIVKHLFDRAYPKVPVIKTSSTIAEMVKYTTNCFLATKVSFANEISQVCGKLNIDYDKVIEYARYDERLGSSHWAVPGPDGKKGFSGSCFPKDINGLMAVARKLHIEPKVLAGAWKKNLEVRPERDWEKLVGRAVSNNLSPSKTLYWSRAPGKFVNKMTGAEVLLSSTLKPGLTFQGTVREWYETLVETIIDVSNLVLAGEKRDKDKRMEVIASPSVMDILACSIAYHPSVKADGTWDYDDGTGVLNHRFHTRIDEDIPVDEVRVIVHVNGQKRLGVVKVLDGNFI